MEGFDPGSSGWKARNTTSLDVLTPAVMCTINPFLWKHGRVNIMLVIMQSRTLYNVPGLLRCGAVWERGQCAVSLCRAVEGRSLHNWKKMCHYRIVVMLFPHQRMCIWSTSAVPLSFQFRNTPTNLKKTKLMWLQWNPNLGWWHQMTQEVLERE